VNRGKQNKGIVPQIFRPFCRKKYTAEIFSKPSPYGDFVAGKNPKIPMYYPFLSLASNRECLEKV